MIKAIQSNITVWSSYFIVVWVCYKIFLCFCPHKSTHPCAAMRYSFAFLFICRMAGPMIYQNGRFVQIIRLYVQMSMYMFVLVPPMLNTSCIYYLTCFWSCRYASESISLACKYAYRNATPGSTLTGMQGFVIPFKVLVFSFIYTNRQRNRIKGVKMFDI